MEQVFEALGDFLEDNWVKALTGLAVMIVGWILGDWRARRRWEKKEFYDRLNVSLNSLCDGTLLIRTVLEKGCDEIFLNSVAVEAVTEAAENTTVEDPILPLPEKDYWYYLNSVLNEISEYFAHGQVRRDQGQDVTVTRYLICLTSECDGEVRTRKIRVMLVQRALLENLPEERPNLESDQHSTRWKTLQILANELQKNSYKFMEIEICI